PEHPGHPAAAAGGEGAHDLAVDLLVRRHRRRRVVVGGVGGPGLRALGEGEDEHPAEPAREPAEHPGAERTAPRVPDVLPEQLSPVLLVTALSFREREEDLPLLTGAAAGEVTVDGGLGTLVGEVAAPAADLRAGRLGTVGGAHG